MREFKCVNAPSREEFDIALEMARSDGWVDGPEGPRQAESGGWIQSLERWMGRPGVATRIFHDGWSEMATEGR